jgi:hypothetical protein
LVSSRESSVDRREYCELKRERRVREFKSVREVHAVLELLSRIRDFFYLPSFCLL